MNDVSELATADQHQVEDQQTQKRVTELEHLQVKNLYQELQLRQQRIVILDMEKNQIIREMHELQAQMQQKKEELSAKYGVDLGSSSAALRSDGTIEQRS